MVTNILKEQKIYFQCDECKLIYEDKKWAEKCEVWCKEHNSCNLEIIEHSLKNA